KAFKPVHLTFERLETRFMPSVTAFAPRRPTLLDGLTASTQGLGLFGAASPGPRPLAANDTANSSQTGAFTYAATGDYALPLTVSGHGPASTIGYSQTGTVHYELSQDGTAAGGAYTFSTVSLSQDFDGAYLFNEWAGSTTLRSLGGSANYNV